MAVLLRWDLIKGLIDDGQGRWLETDPGVAGRSGPLARGCDQGFSVGVVCWMESDLEVDGLEWKAGTRMISRA